MRKFLPALLFLFLLGGLSAQVTINNSVIPDVGDSLMISTDNLPTQISLTPAGGDQSWNYTSLQAPFSTNIPFRPASEGSAVLPGATMFAELAPNVETYFSSTASQVDIVGLFGGLPIGEDIMLSTVFDPPMAYTRTPMNFLDLNQLASDVLVPIPMDQLPAGLIDQLPITPDSLRLKVTIERTDLVDAWGTMMIPGGIYDVLRERRFQTQETRIEAKVSVLPWSDVTDVLLLAVPQLEEFLGQDTTIAYNFYANDVKQPVVTLNVDNDDATITSASFKSSDIIDNVQQIDAIKPGVYVFPNPAVSYVKFEFTNLPAGAYKLSIYNIIGKELWNKRYQINGDYIEQVPINFLRRGTYLYSLQDEQGKTVMTRRLVVVSP